VHALHWEAIDRAKAVAQEKVLKGRVVRRVKEIEVFLRQAPLKPRELETKLRVLSESQDLVRASFDSLEDERALESRIGLPLRDVFLDVASLQQSSALALPGPSTDQLLKRLAEERKEREVRRLREEQRLQELLRQEAEDREQALKEEAERREEARRRLKEDI